MRTGRPTRLLALLVAAGVLLAACSGGGGEDKSENEDVAGVEVWAVGDGPDAKEFAVRVARMIAKAKPHRVLYLGDVYGNYEQRFDKTFGAAGIVERVLPTPGNHEWPSQRNGYLRYWAAVKGEPQPTYYSTRLGGWQVISLNSEEAIGRQSPQIAWLREQVGAGTCRIAFTHRPRYSAGRHGDQLDMEPIWEQLAGHTTLYLAGNDHTMQRLAPRDGITTLIAGSGGRNFYTLDRSNPDLEFGNNTDFGALRLRLSPGRADYTFVSLDGEELDSGRLRCRP